MTIDSNMVCGKYVEVSFTEGGTTINTGLLDNNERKELVKELRRAADDIESWRTVGYTPPSRDED